ncbi:MAG: hypothetical protein NC123_17265 [Butyrivibrio sp.]|nr:hypothetical protein [Butyrivibrio sp.]
MSGLSQYKDPIGLDEKKQDAPFDAYSVIRSPEIRDFYRNNVKLDTTRQSEIILHSYIPMRQKTAMLRTLALQEKETEGGILDDVCSALKKCMDDIYAPAERTLFILEYVSSGFEDYRFNAEAGLDDFYDMAEEMFRHIEKAYEGSETYAHGYVSFLQIPQSEKTKNPFDFTVYWLNGQWQVKDIMIEEDYLKSLINHEIREEVAELLDYYNTTVFEHFPLPFADGSRLKLQAPCMPEPFYGILSSRYDHWHDEWYHYLRDESKPEEPEGERYRNSVPLHSMELDDFSGYSTLDWLERAD